MKFRVHPTLFFIISQIKKWVKFALGFVKKGDVNYEKNFIFGFSSNYAFMLNANHLGFRGIRYYG